MGDRITFPIAGFGGVNLSSRFQFVKGWETGGTDPMDGSVECGDLTAYPMEVTGANLREIIDKISEIYYRVKVATFTENTLAFSFAAGGVITASMTPRVQSETPTGLYYIYLMHGYWAIDDATFPVSSEADPLLGTQYAADIYDPANFGAPLTLDFRDISDKERVLWYEAEAGESPQWHKLEPSLGLGSFYTGSGSLGGTDEQYFRTAFSWYSISDGGTLTAPTIAVPYVTDTSLLPDIAYESLEVLVEFNGKIGVVGDIENIFDAANTFYLGLTCKFKLSGTSIEYSTAEPATVTTGNYVIRLPSGDLSCPFGTVSSPTLTGDLVSEAVEWFEYADKSGDPAWDSTDGTQINGGALG